MAREGAPFILGPAVLAGGLWLAGFPAAAVAALVLSAACVLFFRDPERRIPSDPAAIVSPADGKVVAVDRKPDSTRVSIFLSILDVHVNRAPISGTVGSVRHTPGRFRAAFDPRASESNERTSLSLRGQAGEVEVSQIAGLIARRIVCRAREGDRLERGQRFGLIRFGSRTDLVLPDGATPAVGVGERVRGGQSIIARWDDGPAEAGRR